MVSRLVLLVFGSASVSAAASTESCELEQDESTLIALRAHRKTTPEQRSQSSEEPPFHCPGSPDDIQCDGNQCCPGVPLTGNETFRCQNADHDFHGCALDHWPMPPTTTSTTSEPEKCPLPNMQNGQCSGMTGYCQDGQVVQCQTGFECDNRHCSFEGCEKPCIPETWKPCVSHYCRYKCDEAKMDGRCFNSLGYCKDFDSVECPTGYICDDEDGTSREDPCRPEKDNEQWCRIRPNNRPNALSNQCYSREGYCSVREVVQCPTGYECDMSECFYEGCDFIPCIPKQ